MSRELSPQHPAPRPSHASAQPSPQAGPDPAAHSASRASAPKRVVRESASLEDLGIEVGGQYLPEGMHLVKGLPAEKDVEADMMSLFNDPALAQELRAALGQPAQRQ